jgi:FtsP/CotA-like multicopper oxidase with cupredoxin domain
MPAIVRLATGTGKVAPDVTWQKRRQLTLVEVMGMGGPVEVLVNNTKWSGKRDNDAHTPVPGGQPIGGNANYATELPQVGSTELWEIINLTADSHPIHLHLVQFQIVNRQAFNQNNYGKLYNSLFPGGTYGGVDMVTGKWTQINYPPGVFIPAYGPPGNYNTLNADQAIGGNPAFTPFLQGPPISPEPNEAGWKDTARMNTGFVTRILVRWAPQDLAVSAVTPGVNQYPFDPTQGPGYVWHCHIIDHEDNEMMRPYIPVMGANNAGAKAPAVAPKTAPKPTPTPTKPKVAPKPTPTKAPPKPGAAKPGSK